MCCCLLNGTAACFYNTMIFGVYYVYTLLYLSEMVINSVLYCYVVFSRNCFEGRIANEQDCKKYLYYDSMQKETFLDMVNSLVGVWDNNLDLGCV